MFCPLKIPENEMKVCGVGSVPPCCPLLTVCCSGGFCCVALHVRVSWYEVCQWPHYACTLALVARPVTHQQVTVCL